MSEAVKIPSVPDPTSENCLDRIHQSLSSLDGVRLRVANYILQSPWDAHGLSIGELAQLSGVSENAVNRFSRSLGYSGYREFSQALSLDLGRTRAIFHSQPLDLIHETDEDNNPLTLVIRVFEMELAAMRDTVTNLQRHTVDQAIAALAGARRIVFIGTGSAAPLCQMAQYRCSNLGLASTWTADPMCMVSEVSSLGPEDVVLAVSYSGQGRAVLETLSYVQKKRGATTIGLTAARGSQISEHADICLDVFGPEVSTEIGQFTARTAGLVLLEAIITAVGVTKFGALPPTLSELGDIMTRVNSVDAKWRPVTEKDVTG